MVSRDVIFWAVDTQADFMLPDGKLYVPGAEHLLTNLSRLVDQAREGRVLLISHGCIHLEGDPEFAQFPPHCIRDTPGAKFVPHALANKVFTVPNHENAQLPADLHEHEQILLEKDTLDVFESRHVAEIIQALKPERRDFHFWSGDGNLREVRGQGLARAGPPCVHRGRRHCHAESRRRSTRARRTARLGRKNCLHRGRHQSRTPSRS